MLSMLIASSSDNHYVSLDVLPTINKYVTEMVPLERAVAIETAPDGIVYALVTAVIRNILTYSCARFVRHNNSPYRYIRPQETLSLPKAAGANLGTVVDAEFAFTEKRAWGPELCIDPG